VRCAPVLFLPVFASVVAAAPGAEPAPRDLYEHLVRATGWIVTPSRGKGTGWVLDRGRKWLITNYHVVSGHDAVDVVFAAYRNGRLVAERSYYLDNDRRLREEGRIVSGRVLRTDRSRDLALVELDRVPAGIGELKLAPGKPRPGEEVHSLGNRGDLDLLWAHTTGHVRQVYRTGEGYFWHGWQLAREAGVVLTQSPINEGDSGGPLVNRRGEVVAVLSGVRWQARLATLGIDADEVRALTGQKRENKESNEEPKGAGAAVYRKALRSVALVKTSSSNARATAWVFDAERRVLVTALGATEGQDFVEMFFPHVKDGRLHNEPGYYRDQRRVLRATGHAQRGRVLARDAQRGLAVVEVDILPEGTVALPLAEAEAAPGDRLHVVGHPSSVEALWVYASGSVRQRGRVRLGTADEGALLQVIVAQLPLSDGDRGAPVLDHRGQVVGLLTGKDAPQQLVSYALDASEVKAFLAASKGMWAPHDAPQFARRAALYARLRLWDRAVADLDEVLRKRPDDAAALSERAWALLQKGDAARAIAGCDAAIRIAPRQARAHAYRAAAFSHKGDLQRAIENAAEALRLDPKNALAFAIRSGAYRLRGDLDRAIADGTEAVWLDPNQAPGYHARGLAYLKKGDFDRAVGDLARAASLDPHWPGAWKALGDAHRGKGEEDKAARAYEKARQLDE
jgi:S1-C subfamily serine protease/Tfp pilus assembly protein PilF